MASNKLTGLWSKLRASALASLPVGASQGVDPLVEHLWPLPVPEFSVATLRTWTEQTLQSRLTGDALRDNVILNKWEFANGITVLKSFPWRLSVPFILCNAQCEFCAAWLMKGNAPLDELMTSLIPVIRHCYQLDLVGWGEPLIHPQFSTILELLRRESDPRARMALTTNGVRLGDWIERLLDANVMEYAISIHAANKDTHQDLMGLGPEDFDCVTRAVRNLTARKAEFPKLTVEMVLVVTQQNIPEIPAFIEMSEHLGADQVHLRTLMPMDNPREGLDYHRLPPYLHPEFDRLRDAAVAAISRSRLRVKVNPATWSRPLFSPEWESRLDRIPLTPRKDRKSYRISEIQWDALGAGEASREHEPWHFAGNPHDRSAPLYCPSPYTAFYVNGTDRRVIPCVYMHKVPSQEFIHFNPR
jgi:MoaA/NifB/PqqE/SkfB family radical SAM enzyme